MRAAWILPHYLIAAFVGIPPQPSCTQATGQTAFNAGRKGRIWHPLSTPHMSASPAHLRTWLADFRLQMLARTTHPCMQTVHLDASFRGHQLQMRSTVIKATSNFLSLTSRCRAPLQPPLLLQRLLQQYPWRSASHDVTRRPSCPMRGYYAS